MNKEFYLEELKMIEEDLKNAEEETERALDEVAGAIEWYRKMQAKVRLEKHNLLILKKKNI